MSYRCQNCNKEINKTSNIYLAFDSKCCSNICRNIIISENYKIDRRMLYPFLWIANRNKIIKNIEITPKYNYSTNNLNNSYLEFNNFFFN